MLGWVFGGVGVAAIAAGAVMYVVGGPKVEASGVTIAPTRSGVIAGWTYRF